MPGGAFLAAAGFGLGHVDKMVLATRDLLQQHEKLMAWCGGRCRRVDLARFTPTGTAPFIAIGGTSWDTDFAVGCSTKLVTIGTVIVYEAPLDEIADDQPTEAVLIETWEPVILNAQTLVVPRFGNRPLARRVTELAAVSLDAGERESTKTKIIHVLSATYEVHWNTLEGRMA